jgi:rSAM/selenodomain-associated transferase 2
MRISIVVPVLNEAPFELRQTLARARSADEVLVVDGGSDASNVDMTRNVCKEFGAQFLTAPKGRASQLNFGAQHASEEWLLFLHADVLLPPAWRQRMESILIEAPELPRWGRFDVHFRLRHTTAFRLVVWRVALSVVAWFMNQRSRLTGISTGDQAQFIERKAFVDIGGLPAIALMEDVAFSKLAVKRIGKPLNLRIKVSVSARRWENHGFWHTVLLMWKLRWQYWRGADPNDLRQAYYR